MASLIRYVIGRSRSLLRTTASSSASPQLSIQTRHLKATMCMHAHLPATNSVMTDCETDCETSCETDCETHCETDCETDCETSCETDCETNCETDCETDEFPH